jgi:uracil phosphoribosyltransferase
MKYTILDSPYHLSLLAELGSPQTKQPRISQLVEAVFESMFGTVVSAELASEKIKIKTRIFHKDQRGIFQGTVIKRKQKVVVVNVLRAGLLPSNIFYRNLCGLLNHQLVREDHLMAQRIETKRGVNGTNLSASKVGGPVKGAIVIIPDPMGATGGSMHQVIDFYEKNYGPAKKYIAVHAVITPQYLKKLATIKAPLSVYAARQDLGLTADDFIYPGLGGMGEIINNTKK